MNFLTQVKTYHVLQGSYESFNNQATFIRSALTAGNFANVTGGQRVQVEPDSNGRTFLSGLLQNSSRVGNGLRFNGGYVHIIDKVLTLPQNVSTSLVAANLTSAVGAFQALNLSRYVNKPPDLEPDLTIFIPNNAAFQRVGGLLSNLTTQRLTTILAYHVVPGVYYSTYFSTDGIKSLATLGM